MPNDAEPQVSVLRESLWVLRRRYYVVVIAVVVCALGAWLMVRSQPKMYRATARLLIEPRRSRFANAGTGSVLAAHYYFYRFELQTQILFIKSRPVAERVVKRLDLENRGPFAEMMRAGKDATEAGSIELPPEADDAPPRRTPDLAQLVAGLTMAEPVGETRFIDISVETIDAEWSAKIANAVAEEYIAESIAHRRGLLRESIRAYEERAPELNENLEKAEAALSAFQEREGFLVSSERPEEAMREQEMELKAELLRARRERVAAQAKMMSGGADVTSGDAPVVSDSVATDDPWIRELLDDRLTQVSLVNELRKSFSDGHPKLETAKSRLEAIESELSRASRAYNARLKSTFEAAQWKEKEIEKFLAEHREQIVKLRSQLAAYEALRQKRDSLRGLLNPLSREQAELGFAANIDLANASVTEPATIPFAPSRPNKIKYMLIAIVLGLAMGGWLAYAIDGLDETIRTPDNLRKTAPINVLGTVSVMGRAVARRGNGRAFAADSVGAFVLAEEFRSIRTGLLTTATWYKEGTCGVVLATSPGLGEGKTTISVNTAEAFAQLGKPVIIVDADIRRARVHDMLSTPRAPGLVDVLEGKTALKDAVRRTDVPNLSLLPAGGETHRPAEILASDGVAALIDELKKDYALVWIDSPPVMLVADARSLVPRADLVLIVVRSTSTRRREFERTYELVAAAAGVRDHAEAADRIVAVVNAAPDSVAKQSGYYRSGYGRYYRPNAPATPEPTSEAPT